MKDQIIWLEDDTKKLKWLEKVMNKPGGTVIKYPHPTELIYWLSDNQKKRNKHPDSLIFIIDAMLHHVTAIEYMDGERIKVEEPEEAGIFFIETVLRNQGSTFEGCPVAVLTQRWLRDGKLQKRIDRINMKSPDSPEVLIFSKNKDDSLDDFEKWLSEMVAS